MQVMQLVSVKFVGYAQMPADNHSLASSRCGTRPRHTTPGCVKSASISALTFLKKLKLSDVAFVSGDLVAERFLRELYYGSLRER